MHQQQQPRLPWHAVMEGIARHPEPLRSVHSRMRQLATIASCCRATAQDVRTFGYVPLAQEFVSRPTRDVVEAFLGMDLALTADQDVVCTAFRLNLVALTPRLTLDIRSIRAALLDLQRRFRALPEALMLLVEVNGRVMKAGKARATYLLRAGEFRGRRIVPLSDALDACLRRYGSSAGLERERARRDRLSRARRARADERIVECRKTTREMQQEPEEEAAAGQ